MRRHWHCLAAIGLAILSSGCAQCQSPYDYCGPTFLGPKCPGEGDPCFFCERAGSILAPAPVATFGMPSEGVIQGQTVEEGVITSPSDTEPPEPAQLDATEEPSLEPSPDSGAGPAPQGSYQRGASVARTFRR
jgi:hypothetical protein